MSKKIAKEKIVEILQNYKWTYGKISVVDRNDCETVAKQILKIIEKEV